MERWAQLPEWAKPVVVPKEQEAEMSADGFNAFGKPVPIGRQVSALDCAVEVMGVDPMLADPVIQTAARYIELDKIFEAQTVLRNIVDLTGAYRLMAVMCTDD
jgi:hypothetical protein